MLRVRRNRAAKRIDMSAEGDTPLEIKSHAKSYSLFAGMMKWGAIVSFVLAMLVVFMIAE